MAAQQITKLFEIHSLVKMPDVQLYEESAVSGARPLLYGLPGIFDAAPREVSAAVPVHLLRFQIFNCQHGHPLDDVIFQPCNLDLSELPARYDAPFLPRLVMPAALFELSD